MILFTFEFNTEALISEKQDECIWDKLPKRGTNMSIKNDLSKAPPQISSSKRIIDIVSNIIISACL